MSEVEDTGWTLLDVSLREAVVAQREAGMALQPANDMEFLAARPLHRVPPV